jgi:hypothetical protein
MRRISFWVVLVALAGCGVTTPTAQPTTVTQHNTPAPTIVVAPTLPAAPTALAAAELEIRAQAALARYRSVDPSQVTVVKTAAIQWPSRALGCPAPNVRYASIIVPGYQIQLSLDRTSYTLHTDTAGEIILCDGGLPTLLSNVSGAPVAQPLPPAPTSAAPAPASPAPTVRARPTAAPRPKPTLQPQPPTEQPTEVPTMPAATGNGRKVIDQHASDFNVDPATISVLIDEEIDWPSSAAGCPKPGVNYLDVITPGFRVVIEQGGQQYSYHAGRSGNFFLCDRRK